MMMMAVNMQCQDFNSYTFFSGFKFTSCDKKMQKKIARVLFFMTSIELNNCTDVVADFVDYQFGGSACRWEHE